jgi:parvulin-like peptidyl-prolyl isomerase
MMFLAVFFILCLYFSSSTAFHHHASYLSSQANIRLTHLHPIIIIWQTTLMSVCYRSLTSNLKSMTRRSSLEMNFFGNLFKKKKSASAAHILVSGPDSQQFLMQLKLDLNKKAKDSKSLKSAFNDAARQYSTCPSAKKGGELGTFQEGLKIT